MSLIFDQFPSMDAAEAFAAEAKARFELGGKTFTTDAGANDDDPFPFVRIPPIAHIDRVDDDEARAMVSDPELEELMKQPANAEHDPDGVRRTAAEERVESLAFEYGGEFAGT